MKTAAEPSSPPKDDDIHGQEDHQSESQPRLMGQRARPGVDDLETPHPRIASEADGWDPSLFLPSSNKRLEWKWISKKENLLAIPGNTLGLKRIKKTEHLDHHVPLTKEMNALLK